MEVPEIVGQDEAIQILDRELTSEKVSHAHLLWGPSGSGKTLLARRFVLALNCAERRETGLGSRARLWFCGQCCHCRKIMSDSHPDFNIIVPEGDSIKIDQIREMQSRISRKPNESHLKTWLLDGADHLTEEAQNCLLKVVEEPPGDAAIILTAENPGLLRPTVVSRCQRVRLSTVDPARVREWAERTLGVSAERARFLAALSGGLPGQVIKLVSDDAYFALRKTIISTVRTVLGCGSGAKAIRTSSELLDALKKAADREDGPAVRGIASPEGAMDVIAGWFRDLFVRSVPGGEELVTNLDWMSELEEDSSRYSVKTFERLAARAMRVGRALRGNANARLAFDDFFLYLALLH